MDENDDLLHENLFERPNFGEFCLWKNCTAEGPFMLSLMNWIMSSDWLFKRCKNKKCSRKINMFALETCSRPWKNKTLTWLVKWKIVSTGCRGSRWARHQACRSSCEGDGWWGIPGYLRKFDKTYVWKMTSRVKTRFERGNFMLNDDFAKIGTGGAALIDVLAGLPLLVEALLGNLSKITIENIFLELGRFWWSQWKKLKLCRNDFFSSNPVDVVAVVLVAPFGGSGIPIRLDVLAMRAGGGEVIGHLPAFA